MMRSIQLSSEKPKRRHSKPDARSKTHSPHKENTGDRHLKKKILAEIKAGGVSNEYLPARHFSSKQRLEAQKSKRGTLLNSCQNANVDNSMIKTNSKLLSLRCN